MKTIIVPGNSPKNAEWSKRFLADNNRFGDVIIVEYSHWYSGEKNIDIKKETERLAKLIPGSERYRVIAKSAGILLSMNTKGLNPESFLFLGLPLKWAKENEFNLDNAFDSLSVPTAIIQNENDPLASSNEIREFLIKNNLSNRIKLISSPGNTHEYDDLELISSVLDGIR